MEGKYKVRIKDKHLEKVHWLGVIGRKHAVFAGFLVHSDHPTDVDLLAVDELVSVSETYLIVFLRVVVVNSLVNGRFYVVCLIVLLLWLLLLKLN